jgi:hypothetical protein
VGVSDADGAGCSKDAVDGVLYGLPSPAVHMGEGECEDELEGNVDGLSAKAPSAFDLICP